MNALEQYESRTALTISSFNAIGADFMIILIMLLMLAFTGGAILCKYEVKNHPPLVEGGREMFSPYVTYIMYPNVTYATSAASLHTCTCMLSYPSLNLQSRINFLENTCV